MIKIIIGTTPTITYKFHIVSPTEFRTAILTIRANTMLIERTLESATIEEDSISWTLTQEETLLLGAKSAKMMLNWVTVDGTRGASEETSIMGANNHKREVI